VRKKSVGVRGGGGVSGEIANTPGPQSLSTRGKIRGRLSCERRSGAVSYDGCGREAIGQRSSAVREQSWYVKSE